MMSSYDIICEYWNTLGSKKEKRKFIKSLKKFADELKEELENE